MAVFDGIEPVNLGNPGELTVDELLGHVIALAGEPRQVVHRPLPVDDPRRRRPDIGRARELLDWEPLAPLSEGLAATCACFEESMRCAGSGLGQGRR